MSNKRKVGKRKPSLSDRSRSPVSLVNDHIHRFVTEDSYDEEGNKVGHHRVCTESGCSALRNLKDAPYGGTGPGLNRAARRSRAKG